MILEMEKGTTEIIWFKAPLHEAVAMLISLIVAIISISVYVYQNTKYYCINNFKNWQTVIAHLWI
jgi:hypothetical protein